MVFTKIRERFRPQLCFTKRRKMKAVPKTELLERLEARVEGHLQRVTGKLQNLERPVLLQPAPDGGWSMAQCLEHLNSYGRYYLPAIEHGLDRAAYDAPGGKVKGTWLGAYFTRMMEPGGTRKYKAPKDHVPPPQLDCDKVISEFIAQQEQLLLLIRKAGRVDPDKVRIPISISRWIKLRLGDVFQFLVAHDERHLQQALRLLSR